MAIALDELLPRLEADLVYPVTTEAVLGQIGTAEIEAPDRSDSQTVAEVLEPVGEETFGSAEALFEALLGNLSDDYVGRKFYDDRGANIEDASSSAPHDVEDESF